MDKSLKSRRLFWIFLSILYAGGLVYWMYRIEPRVLSLEQAESQANPKRHIFGPFALKPFDSSYVSVPSSQYRGNHFRQGNYPNERVSLSLELSTLNPLVNVEVHTASKSSPAIDESGIYVGSDSGWFYKFNFAGELVWKFYFSSATKGVHATAALDQSRVYIGAYNGRLYALDKETGHPDWILEVGAAIGSSAVIFDNALYVSIETSHPNGYILKVRPSDGQVIWTTEFLGNHPHSSPALDPERNLLVVGANNQKLHGIDMTTGKILWEFPGEGMIKGTPTIVGDAAYFTSWGRKIFKIDTKTGEDVWETFIFGESQSSPTFIPDLGLLVQYSSGGALTAVKADNGEIAWRLDSGIKRALLSVVATRDELGKEWLVWGKCSVEEFCAIRARDGTILKRWPVGYLSGVPVVFRGEIFFSLDFPGGLHKLGRSK